MQLSYPKLFSPFSKFNPFGMPEIIFNSTFFFVVLKYIAVRVLYAKTKHFIKRNLMFVDIFSGTLFNWSDLMWCRKHFKEAKRLNIVFVEIKIILLW